MSPSNNSANPLRTLSRLLAAAPLCAVLASCVVVPARTVVTTPVVHTVTFYETLSPHGQWLVVEHYGRVWRPHRHLVGADFVPYLTGGHWVYTDSGWVFDAQWEWAWLPFHYGRWYEDEEYGWLWLPGTVWASAWVEWRIGGGYVGWLPLPPPRHRARPHRWCFVETRHFVAKDPHHHRVEPVRAAAVFESTAPVPPSGTAYADEPSWSEGPPIAQLQQEAIEIPRKTLRPPPPVTSDRVFPRELPAARDVARAPQPAPAPSVEPARPAPDLRPREKLPPIQREPERRSPEPFRPPPPREVARPAPRFPQPAPVPPPQQQQEDPRKKKKPVPAPTAPSPQVPGRPLGEPPAQRAPTR